MFPGSQLQDALSQISPAIWVADKWLISFLAGAEQQRFCKAGRRAVQPDRDYVGRTGGQCNTCVKRFSATHTFLVATAETQPGRRILIFG